MTIIDRIKAALTPELLTPKYRLLWKPENPTFGFCYIAAEALWHSLGGAASGFIPHVGRDAAGIPHWWLQNRAGVILDPTAEQYTSVGLKPPYDNGRGCGFLTRQPSRRAQAILDRIGSAA